VDLIGRNVTNHFFGRFPAIFCFTKSDHGNFEMV
jgi:hypothetical protein